MWGNFTRPFNFDRRPAQAIAFSVEPGLRNLPRDVVLAAIAAGAAKPAKPPSSANPAASRRNRLKGHDDGDTSH